MNDSEHDVGSLVRQARQGDTRAIGSLYDLYAARIYRYLAYRVPEPSDAEDLLQTVFMKMITALPRIRPDQTHITAWLFATARNAAIDLHRTRRVHAPLDEALPLPDESPTPAESAERAVDASRVHAALAQLTDAQREVIVLRFFGGLTPEEVARVMRRRNGAVRGLQFRALETLRQELGLPEDEQ